MTPSRHFWYLMILLIPLAGCSRKEFKKNPVDELIRDMPANEVFSIILYDMDVQGNFYRTFLHQYKLIEEDTAGTPSESITGWFEVSEDFFNQHVNDMGMEIAARGRDGKLSKSAAPPGYNNYVGNEKYGRWESSGGNSFWAFYGQYAFMSSMFNMLAYPVRRSYYDDWRGGYYGRGRSYYGPTTASGRRYYGTNSDYNTNTRRNSSWSRNNSSFKRQVASRTSRSSSRYGSGSYRSRGGGYGK